MAVGYQALLNSTFAPSSGNENTAIGNQAMRTATTAGANVAIGSYALTSLTTGGNSVAVGNQALNFATTGSQNVAIGLHALYVVNGGSNNVAVGFVAGGNNLVSGNYNTLLGNATGVSGDYSGTVVIGCDSSGTGASATANNQFVLGTANHQVRILNNTTGTGSPSLGANSPATTNSAPYTWFKMMSSDGSNVYVPAWK